MTVVTFLIELIKYIFLGFVQGITEVLPISSSGHVTLSQSLLQIGDDGLLFLILVNLGSLIAIILYFRKMIKRLIVNSWCYLFKKSTRDKTTYDFHYVLKIVIASIPTGVIGFFWFSSIEAFYTSYTLFVVAIGLLITSTFLYIVRYSATRNVTQTLTYKDAIVIGLIQPFSMFPGLSRSGITTSTGLLRKVSMDTSLTFSLMLYIPISIGSFIYYIYKWTVDPSMIGFDYTNVYQYIYFSFAFIASLIATAFSLKYIFILFRRGKLIYFSIYTMILGMIALIAAVMTY